MSRTAAECFKDLRGLLAELEHALKAEGKASDEEISPLLKAALASPVEPDPETRRQLKEAVKKELAPIISRTEVFVPRPEKPQTDLGPGRGYMAQPEPNYQTREILPTEINRPERRERLKDYTPADDPDWDEAVFMGTGDRRVD